jgi:hypothetical protein
MKTVCVDFNGVLDTYTGWRGPAFLYPPREGAGAFLSKLSERYRVVVLTTFDAALVWEWLRRYGFDAYVGDVTNHKVPAVVYVDDRAVRFDGDFEATLREIEAFRTHWERGRP